MLNIQKCLKNPLCIIFGIIIIFIIILLIVKIYKKNIEKFESGINNLKKYNYNIKPCNKNVCSIQLDTSKCIKEIDPTKTTPLSKEYNDADLKKDLATINTELKKRYTSKDATQHNTNHNYIENCVRIGDLTKKFNSDYYKQPGIKNLRNSIINTITGMFKDNIWKSAPAPLSSDVSAFIQNIAADGSGAIQPAGGSDSIQSSGGSGSIQPAGGSGSIQPAGGSDSIQPAGGSGSIQSSGGSGSIQPAGGSGAIQPTGGAVAIQPTGGAVAGSGAGSDSSTGNLGVEPALSPEFLNAMNYNPGETRLFEVPSIGVDRWFPKKIV